MEQNDQQVSGSAPTTTEPTPSVPVTENENFQKMYNLLYDNGHTSESPEDFLNNNSTGESFSELHGYLKNKGLTTLSPGDFQQKYFGVTEDHNKKKSISQPEDGGESASEPVTTEAPDIFSPEAQDFGFKGEYSTESIKGYQSSIGELEKQREKIASKASSVSLGNMGESFDLSSQASEIDYQISDLRKKIKTAESVYWLAGKEKQSDGSEGMLLSDMPPRDLALEYLKENDFELYEKYTSGISGMAGSIYSSGVVSSVTGSPLLSFFNDMFLASPMDTEVKKDYDLMQIGLNLKAEYLSAQQVTLESEMKDRFGNDYELLDEYDKAVSNYKSATQRLTAIEGNEQLKSSLKDITVMDDGIVNSQAQLKSMEPQITALQAQVDSMVVDGALAEGITEEQYQTTVDAYNSASQDYNKKLSSIQADVERRNSILNDLKGTDVYSEYSKEIDNVNKLVDISNKINEEISDEGWALITQNGMLNDKMKALDGEFSERTKHLHYAKIEERQKRNQERLEALTNEELFDGSGEYAGAFVQPFLKTAKGLLEAGYVAETALGGSEGYSFFEQIYDMSTTNTFVEDMMLPEISEQGLISEDGVAPSYVWASKTFNTLGNVASFMASGGLGGSVAKGVGLGAKVGSNLAVSGSAYMMQVGDNYREAVALGMDRQDAAISAEVVSSVSAITELLVSELDLADDVVSAVSKGIYKDVLARRAAGEVIDAQAVKEIGRSYFSHAIKAVPKAALSEGLEELTSEAASDATKLFLNNQFANAGDVRYYDAKEMGDVYAYGESFILGAIGGLGVGGATAVRQGVAGLGATIDDIHPRVASVIVSAAENENNLKRLESSLGDNTEAIAMLRGAVQDYKNKSESVERFSNEEAELTKDEKMSLVFLSTQLREIQKTVNENEKSENPLESNEEFLKSSKNKIEDLSKKINSIMLNARVRAEQEKVTTAKVDLNEQTQEDGFEEVTPEEASEEAPQRPSNLDSRHMMPGDTMQVRPAQSRKEQKAERMKERAEKKAKEQEGAKKEPSYSDKKQQKKKEFSSEETAEKVEESSKKKREGSKKKKRQKVQPADKPVDEVESPREETITISEAITSYDDGEVQLRSYGGKDLDEPLVGSVYVDNNGNVIFATQDTEYELGSIHEGKANPFMDINKDLSYYGLELSNEGVKRYGDKTKPKDKRTSKKPEDGKKKEYDSEYVLSERTEEAPQPAREPLPESSSDRVLDNIGRVVTFKVAIDGKERLFRATIVKRENGGVYLDLMNAGGESFFLGSEQSIQDMQLKEMSYAKVEEQAVIAYTDGSFMVDGKMLRPSSPNPVDSIKRNAKGDVTSVTMLDADGNKVEIRNLNSNRMLADGLAYEILLAANDVEFTQEFENRLSSDPEIVGMLEAGDPNKEPEPLPDRTEEEILEDVEEVAEETEVETEEQQQPDETEQPTEQPAERPTEQPAEQPEAEVAEREQVDEPVEEGPSEGVAEDARPEDIKKEEKPKEEKRSPEERIRAEKIAQEKKDEAKKKRLKDKKDTKKEKVAPPVSKPKGKRPVARSSKMNERQKERKKQAETLTRTIITMLKESKLHDPKTKVLARSLLSLVPTDGIIFGTPSNPQSDPNAMNSYELVATYIAAAEAIVDSLKSGRPINPQDLNEIASDIETMSNAIDKEYIDKSFDTMNSAMARMTRSSKAASTYVGMARKLLNAAKDVSVTNADGEQKTHNPIKDSKSLSLRYLSLANAVLEAMRGNSAVMPSYFDMELQEITGDDSEAMQKKASADAASKRAQNELEKKQKENAKKAVKNNQAKKESTEDGEPIEPTDEQIKEEERLMNLRQGLVNRAKEIAKNKDNC